MAENVVPESHAGQRRALLARIESREADIGAYLLRARRRRDRLSLTGVVTGAVVALATAGPAVGGQDFATTVGDTLAGGGGSVVWQVLCVVALVASVLGVVAAGLQRADDVAGKVSAAEACAAELDALAIAVSFQGMPVEEAAGRYWRITARIPFVAET
ncbi:hypothetical protein [Streptomyces sp. YS415]|uniref:hypothetical protein n=1 Tax=Streptomyces sp. YS415 TaxID=2944806 RepID=UPI00201FED87|nr:hypothetical protein [Streptomyces sp. YS415]MCL7430325.1 hypothetical protein [Streptomyces sp. YS415]